MTRQRGVALVTVLLVVSIVTVICAGLILRQQLSIRGAANRVAIQQAWHYALGGEALGQSVLLRDLKKPGSDPRAPIDHPLEDWARPLPVFPIDQGEIGVHRRPRRALQPQQPGAGATRWTSSPSSASTACCCA